MEMQHIGQQCSIPSCRQRDFLPFTCDACSNIYCAEHQKYDDHNCTESYLKDNVVPTCPICSEPIPFVKGENPNITMNRHINSGCTIGLGSPKSKSKSSLNGNNSKRNRNGNGCCYQGRCKEQTLILISCEECGQGFCATHRYPNVHKCEPFLAKKEAALAKSIAQEKRMDTLLKKGRRQDQTSFAQMMSSVETTAASNKSKRKVVSTPSTMEGLREARLQKFQPSLSSSSSSSQSTDITMDSQQNNNNNELTSEEKKRRKKEAAKAQINLMKKKAKAIGNSSLSSKDRFYIEIQFLIDGSRLESAMMYFPKATSIGKVIDEAATVAGISNRNHDPNSPKLTLSLPSISSQPLDPDAQLEFLEICGIFTQGALLNLSYEQNSGPERMSTSPTGSASNPIVIS